MINGESKAEIQERVAKEILRLQEIEKSMQNPIFMNSGGNFGKKSMNNSFKQGKSHGVHTSSNMDENDDDEPQQVINSDA
jgi:hypothetical protein